MHLLPLRLAALTPIAAKSNTRYAMNNIRLRVHGDDTFLAEACDGKRLLSVRGVCVAPAAEYPSFANLDAAPNGATESLIIVDSWKELFARTAKLTRKANNPILHSLAVKVADDVTTFAASSLDQTLCEQVRNGDGRFPDTASVLDAARKKSRLVCRVNPHLMAELLKAMAAFADEGDPTVEIHATADPDKPLYLTANHVGAKAEAVLMPLSVGREEKARLTAEQAGHASAESRVVELEAEGEKLRQDVAAGDRRILDLERALDAVETNARRLAEDRDRLQAELANRQTGDRVNRSDFEEVVGGLNLARQVEDNLRAEAARYRDALADSQHETDELRAENVRLVGLLGMNRPTTITTSAVTSRRERLQGGVK